MKKTFLLILILINVLFSQDKNAQRIVENIKANFDLINDYIVEIKGKVDFPDAVIPELKAKIFFKKPDKFKVESDNFMIIPKQSIRFSPEILYEKDFSTLIIGEVDIDKVKHFIVKLISNNPEVEEVVTIWVNSKNYTIRKMNVIGSRVGKVEIDFYYKLIDEKYWLPEKMVAIFEASRIRFPRIRKIEKEQKDNSDLYGEGKITIEYFNYVVNKGIDDKIFEDKKKSVK
ncbi:MAG: outer membrane lipoprotein-sorting protein [Ignavibacteria bacterium]|nr:outer membrane lipoprotein-sorting protein [Ignavibacteria bacterium]